MTSVLVTGANRGLGLEFVRQYAEDGARVFACAREPDNAADLTAIAAGANGQVSVHRLEVTDDAQVATVAHTLRNDAIDILINNAGIDGSMTEGQVDYEIWAEVFRVNTMAPYRIARAFHGHMKKSKTPKLVAISSRLGSISKSSGYAMDYGSSKAALNYVMHCLAMRWAADGFVTVTMSPGWVKTDMGGDDAPLTPQESIAGMRKVIAALKRSDNGRFLGHRGEEVPW